MIHRCTKCSIKIAIVKGPIHPGTGVIYFTFVYTSSKLTSPTIPTSVELIPTSITIVSFIHELSIKRGDPQHKLIHQPF